MSASASQVLVVPAPDLDGKAHVVDAPHAIDDRQVREDHLGTDRKLEVAHGFVTSLTLTSMDDPII